MCGRYSLSKKPKWEKVRWPEPFLPRFNVAPTQEALVVKGPAPQLASMKWGLIPHWARDDSMAAACINARSESAATKPAFREAFKHRRCAVPVDSFYEWKKSGRKKLPQRIRFPDGEVFWLAGIWDRWKKPEGGEIETFSILTTGSNAVLAPLHDRMPVILKPADVERWIDEKTDPTEAQSMLDSSISEQLIYSAANPILNFVASEGPECWDAPPAEESSKPEMGQMELF